MSTNVYGPQNGPAPDFLRNTYDKQFQNLITTNFGELRPCFCKEVLPGDSVNIDPIVAIRSQPIVFPIQTRMKFYCHFFYGRNRILMNNWEDFIFKTKDGITPPLLKLSPSRAKKMISTGSLGDNLGVPSTFCSEHPIKKFVNISTPINLIMPISDNPFHVSRSSAIDERLLSLVSREMAFRNDEGDFTNLFLLGFITSPIDFSFDSPVIPSDVFLSTFSGSVPHSSDLGLIVTIKVGDEYFPKSLMYRITATVDILPDNRFQVFYHISDNDFESFKELTSSLLSDNGSYCLMIGSYKDSPTGDLYYLVDNSPFFDKIPSSNTLQPSRLSFTFLEDGIIDATDDAVMEYNKFVGDNPSIPISALPYRLYEFICNYYYRNDTNNPYMLDGEVQYNKFIPSTDDGWDENEYLLHKRNWESDMFTTAVPSPQFGTAPLVGLTYNGGLTAEVTTNVTDSDGQTQSLAIKVGVDDEGNITNIFDADTAVPSGSLKSLMDAMSTTGISINTLRNVNSFQRFLENVIRRGLRYRNQLLSHFGVSVDYPDIDIPQFIGGFSGDLVVRDVTNMAESAEVALGDVAGKIDAVIQSNHSINCYCAEHGFIMGIFCIVPVPTYSQVLPHMFTRYDAFDYFQKEFDKIGYVPVTYRNFLPLQSDNPDEVFGYQRAWYEYMSSLDEVHGDFRLTLDDFVLYRIFKDKPTLNESFLTVDSDSLNNIFAVDKVEEKYKNSDKFLCQFYFQYSQKTMIPKHGVASLE